MAYFLFCPLLKFLRTSIWYIVPCHCYVFSFNLLDVPLRLPLYPCPTRFWFVRPLRNSAIKSISYPANEKYLFPWFIRVPRAVVGLVHFTAMMRLRNTDHWPKQPRIVFLPDHYHQINRSTQTTTITHGPTRQQFSSTHWMFCKGQLSRYVL